MSIASEITRLQGAKADLKTAIEAKGVTVGAIALDEYAGKVDMIASNEGWKVQFFDPFCNLLKTEYVPNGQDATAPTPPTFDLLTFTEWNNSFTNVTRDIDVGAIYDTTDGKTYIFVKLDSVTGLQPTICLQKGNTAEMTINWGHGDNSVTSGSGNITIQKPTAYTAGKYTITISCSGTYNLGQGNDGATLFGNISGSYCKITWKVYFGAQTTLLNTSTFYNHTNLCFVILSSTITGSTGASFCDGCTVVNGLVLPPSMTGTINNYLFWNSYNVKVICLPSGMTGNVGGSVFANSYLLDSICIPIGLNLSGLVIFAGCASLQKLSLPANVTLGYNLFGGLTSLTELNLPTGITGSIGNSCFNGMRKLKSLTLPSGLTGAIGNAAFYSLLSLKSLTIPSGITSLGEGCFANNHSMEEYIFQSTNPPTLFDTAVFTGIRPFTRIYVPDASVDSYKTATNWTAYADYIYSINDRP
jgi:hypothetical protein